jgi:hypothetical protein
VAVHPSLLLLARHEASAHRAAEFVEAGPEWRTPRALVVGARIAFVARFLGRRPAYTYQIIELAPGERLVMRTAEGPFPMETTYTWADAGERMTRMTLRNRGTPSGFAPVAAPVMAGAMRRANRKDLRRLKSVLENQDS